MTTLTQKGIQTDAKREVARNRGFSRFYGKVLTKKIMVPNN